MKETLQEEELRVEGKWRRKNKPSTILEEQ